LIFAARNNNPGDILRDFKTFTSKKLQSEIRENIQESRKDWMIWMFERAGMKNSNVKCGPFWQQHNKPIELWTPAVIDQKVDYIHNNPVEAGFVNEPEHWRYSSAIDYSGGKGLIEIDLVSRHEPKARASGAELSPKYYLQWVRYILYRLT
jgi:hypothetical protein